MKELGITKGEYKVDVYRDADYPAYRYHIKLDDKIVIRTERKSDQSTAIVVADALNTAQKCGLLPSGLLQQRDELREALKLLMAGVKRLPPLTGIHGALENQYKIAEAAIKNTER